MAKKNGSIINKGEALFSHENTDYDDIIKAIANSPNISDETLRYIVERHFDHQDKKADYHQENIDKIIETIKSSLPSAFESITAIGTAFVTSKAKLGENLLENAKNSKIGGKLLDGVKSTTKKLSGK